MYAVTLFTLLLSLAHASRPPDVPIVHPGGSLRRRGVPGNQTGLIQYLSNGNSDTYIIHLEIGNPPISYPFQLDTASSDLLVASSLCTSSSCPDVKSTPTTPLYTPGRSTSFESINANGTGFNLTYADDSQASGFLALDRIGIRGAGGQTVVVEDQVMGVLNSTTMDMQALGISGIVGLGFPRLSVLLRDALDEGTGSSTASASATSTRSQTTSASSSTEPLDSTSAFFSILPIETITPLPTSTSTSSSLHRRADAPAYFPPLLENLYAHPSVNSSSPRLSYPVFSLALANSSDAYCAANANASITWGGISSEYVRSGNETGSLPTVDDVDWVQVVPFAHALRADDDATETAAATLEDEEYLYWAVPLVGLSVNGTPLTLEPTYNSSSTGVEGSIALLDVGTNGIYAPQQDVIRIFEQIKDARQVSEGTWAVPCDTEMTMSFTVGTTEILLQPSEWIDAKVGSSGMCLAWPRVAPSAGDGIDWQLGTPVLRKVVVVFSYGISGEQAPLVGLLRLPSAAQVADSTSTTASQTASTTTTSIQNASQILQHVTKTIGTALPNVILPDPSYTTPAYIFTTPPVPAGSLQTGGLGNPLVYSVDNLPIVSVPSTTTSGSAGSAMKSGTAADGARTSSASAGNGNATSGAQSRIGSVGSGAAVILSVASGFLLQLLVL